MSSADDNDDLVTDINVSIDASGLDDASKSREHVITRPVPAGPADFEPHTLEPRLGIRELAGARLPGELLPDQDEVPTEELLLARPAADEEERTHLNAESLMRKALAPLATEPPMASEPPLEETKPRAASSPNLPKSDRTFSMELPPTAPVPFPAQMLAMDSPARPPRARESTVKIVGTPQGRTVIEPGPPSPRGFAAVPATAPMAIPLAPMAAPRVAPVAPLAAPAPLAPMAPVPSRAQAPTAIVSPPRKRTRWGRIVLLLVLAGLGVAGFVERDLVRSFVLTTIAELQR